jgi:hypothetical protein
MAAKLSPSRTVIIENDQILAREAPSPPKSQFHQATVVETSSNKYPYPVGHEHFLGQVFL